MRPMVVVIQARMGSSRLPGKVLQDICGSTMLARTVRRVQCARLIDAVIIATTQEPADDAVVDEATRLQVPICRGSEADVLGRYVQAAREMSASSIVRVTSDCPLFDPGVADLVIATYLATSPIVDYVSNTVRRTYPRGLDVEVFSRAALEYVAHEAKAPHEREHVTPYFYENPSKFRLLQATNSADLSNYRWTVDTPEDLAFVRQVYEWLGKDEFGWREVLALVKRAPGLDDINRNILQKSVRG